MIWLLVFCDNEDEEEDEDVEDEDVVDSEEGHEPSDEAGSDDQ